MTFKQAAKDSAGFVWVWVLIIIAVAAMSYASYLGYQYFAPRYEQVRFDTFKNSQAYNDGMMRELSSFRLQWATASDTQKAAIKAAITQQYGAYDKTRLPFELQDFIRTVEAF